MIQSYGDAETRRFARGAQTRKFEAFRRQLEKTLDRLDAAAGLRDMVNFPGHHLEGLGVIVPGDTPFVSITIGGSASTGPKDRPDQRM
jgi:plasmid maintenance system killer protein